MLRKAIQYFADAKGLVMAQERLHARMMTANNGGSSSINNNNMTEDARFYRRNLLLLRGQAQVNTGIAMVEQARRFCPEGGGDPARRVQLERAGRELEAAVASARAMQAQATEDAATGCSPSETTLDILRAQQLESLARRWKAAALWHLYQKPEAFQSFQEAASVFAPPASFVMSTSTDGEILDVALECRAECYHAWTTLADLASRSLERATVKLIRESPSFYEKVLDFVRKALTNAAASSRTMEAELRPIAGKYRQACEEHGILVPNELSQSLKDIQEWWQRRREAASQRITEAAASTATVASASSLPRSELVDLDAPEALPTQRFLAKPRTRRSKYNLGGTGYSNVGVSSAHATTEERVVTPRAAPRKYRKWCEDEYDEKTGQTVPKLVYPSIAPEMPPHIAAILAARSRETNR